MPSRKAATQTFEIGSTSRSIISSLTFGPVSGSGVFSALPSFQV